MCYAVSLNVSMVHLTIRIHCIWFTYHAIDLSSIGLNRLKCSMKFDTLHFVSEHSAETAVPHEAQPHYIRV